MGRGYPGAEGSEGLLGQRVVCAKGQNTVSLENYKEFNMSGNHNVRELGKWDR